MGWKGKSDLIRFGIIMTNAIGLKVLWRSSKPYQICFYSGASYIQMGFTIYVGHSLYNACPYLLVWQTHAVHFPLGMAYAQTGWHSRRSTITPVLSDTDGRKIQKQRLSGSGYSAGRNQT